MKIEKYNLKKMTDEKSATQQVWDFAKIFAEDDAVISAGDCATIYAGYRARITAGHGAKITAGDYAKISAEDDAVITAGRCAKINLKGKNSIATAGSGSKIKGVKGSWIVLTEYDDGNITAVKSAMIDGKKLKENTFYKLKNGEFVEVK